MNIAIIKNDQGVMYAQIGTKVKNLASLKRLCKKNGEECVDFIQLESKDYGGGQKSLAAIETLCCANNEGFGRTIEEILLQMYQAGLIKDAAK